MVSRLRGGEGGGAGRGSWDETVWSDQGGGGCYCPLLSPSDVGGSAEEWAVGGSLPLTLLLHDDTVGGRGAGGFWVFLLFHGP